MQPRLIFNSTTIQITLKRLCYELIENHGNFEDSVLIGLQPRGIFVARRIENLLREILPTATIHCGNLDVTFFRDDIRRNETLIPSATNIDFKIEGKKVILIDDVLYTGRTIRSGLDAMLAYGRPNKVELLTLIDRRYSRDLPIEPNYVGKEVDTITSEKVIVKWKETDSEDGIWMTKNN